MTDDQYEAAYSDALTAVAMGEERELVRSALLDSYESLDPIDVSDILGDVLRDAIAQGVDQDDIDPSWF